MFCGVWRVMCGVLCVVCGAWCGACVVFVCLASLDGQGSTWKAAVLVAACPNKLADHGHDSNLNYSKLVRKLVEI